MKARSMLFGATVAIALAAPVAHGQGDQDSDRWNWSGTIQDGRWLYVRNLNGAIRVEAASGNQVEVTATKRAHRGGDVRDVKITVEQRTNRGDVVICAIWERRNTRCDEDGYNSNSNRRWSDRDDRGDVSVEFVVRLPKGVRVTTTTVNGGLEIDGVDAEVRAHTVNGSVVARSTGGPVDAGTVNGSLTIRTGQLNQESLTYSTVNGGITLEIPANASADIELRTVNGSIDTDFPLTVEGRFNTRRVRGSIGKGGPLIRLSTTNGSIHLRRG